MALFQVPPLEQYKTASASIKRPLEIACFSYDHEHKLHLDSRSLRYYYPPQIGVSLSKGYENFQKLDDSIDEHLDGLLKAILEKEKREQRRVQADIITWRGIMTKILITPYADFDGFQLEATNFQGTIFIEECKELKNEMQKEEDDRLLQPGHVTPSVMTFWGYKFETLCCMPDTLGRVSRDFIEGRPEHTVSNKEQLCSIVQTGIGSNRLVIGGEVDCVWDFKPQWPSEFGPVDKNGNRIVPPVDEKGGPIVAPPLPPIKWVELKTITERPPHPSQQDSVSKTQRLKWLRADRAFDRKLLKFWAQSFLLGVPKIIIGIRSNHNFPSLPSYHPRRAWVDPTKGMEEPKLLAVEEIDTVSIPALVRDRAAGRVEDVTWERDVCINFAGKFLEFLRQTVVGPGTWTIRRGERSAVIEVLRKDETGTGKILSQEFLEWRSVLAKMEQAAEAS